MSIGSGPACTVKISDCRPFDLPTLRSRWTGSTRSREASGPGALEASPGSDRTQPALLLTAHLQFDLQPGQKIRVLNVHIKSPNEDEGLPVVATMGANSEMFLLSP